MIKTKCAYCGKEIERCRRDYERAKQHFCCIEHKALFQHKLNEIIVDSENPKIAILKIKQFEFIIDSEDIDKINDYKWVLKYDKMLDSYYATAWERGNYKDRKRVLLHRLIMDCPENKEVDHINKYTLDNRKENLRCVDQIINAQNKGFYSNNKSGYKYIYWNKIHQTYVCEIKRLKKVVFRATSKDLTVLVAKRDNFIKEYNKDNGNTITRLSDKCE